MVVDLIWNYYQRHQPVIFSQSLFISNDHNTHRIDSDLQQGMQHVECEATLWLNISKLHRVECEATLWLNILKHHLMNIVHRLPPSRTHTHTCWCGTHTIDIVIYVTRCVQRNICLRTCSLTTSSWIATHMSTDLRNHCPSPWTQWFHSLRSPLDLEQPDHTRDTSFVLPEFTWTWIRFI